MKIHLKLFLIHSRFIALTAVVALALLLMPLVVQADDLKNTLSNSAGAVATIDAPGGSTSVGYFLQTQGNDGQGGCNIAGASKATVTLSIPEGVTASPNPFEILECGQNNAVSVTFSANTPGDYVIAAAGVSDNDPGNGIYDWSAATFTLRVSPPADSTPPVIVGTVGGTLGNNNWFITDVTVSWSVVDPESPVTTTSGCETVVISSDTAGQTLTCSATSTGGSASSSVTVKRDATAPTASASAAPAANASGWNNSDVTVSFNGFDSLSGLASCTPAAVLSGEGAGQSASGTCTDNAGNVSAWATASGINIDKTAPTASAAPDRTPNTNDWYDADVTVTFSGTDGLSGIDFCDAPVVLSAEAAGQSASGTCTDKAGNVSVSATASGINIDKTAPVVTVTGVVSGATYTLGSVPTAGCSTFDALSGVQTPASLAVTGGGPNGVGTFTATCSGALDWAENPGSASATYKVEYAWAGFFRPIDNLPVINSVKAGSAIPVKFSLNGNMGLSIFPSGPGSAPTACVADAVTDDIEVTVTAGNSSLTYDAAADQYVYVWKTEKSWAGTCRVLIVTLNDGTTHRAVFSFKK